MRDERQTYSGREHANKAEADAADAISRVLKTALDVLAGGQDFREDAADWVKDVLAAENCLRAAETEFNDWLPLRACSADAEQDLSLRYLGEEVGRVSVRDGVFLELSGDQGRRNRKNFPDLRLPAGSYDWRGEEAQGFRRYFSLRFGERMP